MLPKIGIVGGISHREERDFLTLASDYTAAVTEQGGLPLILPGDSPAEKAVEYSQLLDGLLLAGGGDVHPCWYGDAAIHPTVTTSPQEQMRDVFEMALVRAFRAAKKPVLGICRGMQVINVTLGGTLYQDIPSQYAGAIGHWQTEARRDETSHALYITPGSHLHRLLQTEELAVNSFHHQAVKELAPGLRATALAPDGLIEGVEAADGRLLAVQCHPECLFRRDPAWRGLFAAFVDLCRGHD